MDLSYAAAVKLGIASRGSAEIEFERLTFDEIRTGAWRPGGEDLAAEAAAPLVPPAPVLANLPDVPANATNVGVVAAGVPVSVVTPTAIPAAPMAATPAAGSAKAFTPMQKGFWVQLAALGKRDGVERLQQRIASELAALQPLLAVFHEAPLFKLQVGPYATREEALAAADQAKSALSLSPMVIERR
jgi:rare lipoprotein A